MKTVHDTKKIIIDNRYNAENLLPASCNHCQN